MQNDSPLIWVLADDKAGHRHQALGVAQALKLPCVTKQLAYTRLAGLPNFLKCGALLGITPETQKLLTPPWPDVVIAAGRRTAPVARAIKRWNKGKTFLAQLMWPGAPVWGFDLIAVPEHDGIAASDLVITTIGAPHHLAPALLIPAKEEWQTVVEHLPRPRIAVLVGGTVGKKGEFTGDEAAHIGYIASRIAGQAEGSLLVSTSRRTPPLAVKWLKESIACAHTWYEYQEGSPNPYLGFLASADAIIVTGDSVSMCSEACFMGKPVFIHVPGNLPAKHRKFLDHLFAEGYAQPLPEGEALPAAESWQGRDGRKLDEAFGVAAEIRKRLNKKNEG